MADHIQKICCFILFFLIVCSTSAQSYDKWVLKIDETESTEEKLELIEEALNSEQFEIHQDTQALFYFEKSYVLFRESVSIEQSIEALDEALALVDENKDREIWIKLWYYKGYWYRKWDKYEEAKQALTKALKYSQNNKYLWHATIQLGKTFKDRGEFSIALDTYDKALVLAADDQDKLATTYEVISFVYLIMDTKEGAQEVIPWLDKLIVLLREMENEDHFIASMTYNKGTAYMTLEDYENAERYFSKAENIIDSCCDDPDFKSLLYESRAIILAEEGKFTEAIDNFKKSLSLYQHSFDLTRSDGLASSYRQIAETYQKKREPLQAYNYITKALSYRLSGIDSGSEDADISISALQSNGEKHYLIDELILKAKILEELYTNFGEEAYLIEANQILHYADVVVDLMRFEHLEESTKEFWRTKTAEVYHLLVRVNYELEEFEQAFRYAEKSKYLLMGEHLIKNEDQLAFLDLPGDLKSDLIDIMNRIQVAKEDLKLAEARSDDQSADSLKFALVDLRKTEDDIISIIKRDFPDYYANNFSFELVSIAEIQNELLAQNQSLVEYFLDDHSLYVFIVDKRKFITRKIDLQTSIIDKLSEMRGAIAHEARNSPEQLQKYANLASEIFDITVRPIEKDISQNVFIVTDDVLSLIPFSILLTERINVYTENRKLNNWPYMVNKYDLSYLKSASLGLFNQRKNTKGKFDKAILAFNPSFGDENSSSDNIRGGLLPLNGSIDEIKFVKDKLDGDFFESASATESNFKNSLNSSYSIFHIASHAIVDDAEPDMSKLVLNEQEEEDGLLHAFEIANLPIVSDLVILSACNTGYGMIQKGEGINSIGKSFAKAGSPNLLMSLWPVSDKATSTLIKEYYDQLFKGYSKRKAIGLAKQSFLSSVPAAYHHPYYWGGFVYYGDDKPLRMAKTNDSFVNSGIWVVGILLALAAFLVLFTLHRRHQNREISSWAPAT